MVEYQYKVTKNFHEKYELTPWSFGMYGEYNSMRLLDAHDAIEIIKYDHEIGTKYNMTYYENKPLI